MKAIRNKRLLSGMISLIKKTTRLIREFRVLLLSIGVTIEAARYIEALIRGQF